MSPAHSPSTVIRRDNIKPSKLEAAREQFLGGTSIRKIGLDMGLTHQETLNVMRYMSREFRLDRDLRYDQTCQSLMRTLRNLSGQIERQSESKEGKDILMIEHLNKTLEAITKQLTGLIDQRFKWQFAEKSRYNLDSDDEPKKRGRPAKPKDKMVDDFDPSTEHGMGPDDMDE